MVPGSKPRSHDALFESSEVVEIAHEAPLPNVSDVQVVLLVRFQEVHCFTDVIRGFCQNKINHNQIARFDVDEEVAHRAFFVCRHAGSVGSYEV